MNDPFASYIESINCMYGEHRGAAYNLKLVHTYERTARIDAYTHDLVIVVRP